MTARENRSTRELDRNAAAASDKELDDFDFEFDEDFEVEFADEWPDNTGMEWRVTDEELRELTR